MATIQMTRQQTGRTCSGRSVVGRYNMPGGTVVALDVHGTLVSRTACDDLAVVQAFRQTISRPARASGAAVVMVSAAPTRELQRVAALLDLGDQPAVAELGHLLLPAALLAPPRLAAGITPEAERALLEVRRWLAERGLPPGVYFEPKTVLVTLNWSQAPAECDGLIATLQAYIAERELPLWISVSDATIDVAVAGIDKTSGLAELLALVGRGPEGRQVLAVGDSRNDLDLLRVSSAALCGCPANAHPTMKEYVLASGGCVAERANLAGTLEVLARLLEAVGSAPTPHAPAGRGWFSRRPRVDALIRSG